MPIDSDDSIRLANVGEEIGKEEAFPPQYLLEA
jgi:hypothetical protein